MDNKFRAAFLFTFVLLTSCNTYRYIYSASPANIAYFQKKGESKFTAYYSGTTDGHQTEEYAHGFDVQGAYALSDHWDIITSYFTRKERDVYGSSYQMYDSSTVDYKRNLFDIGGGYFTSVNEKKNITANLYGGVGFGKFSFIDIGLDKSHRPYNRYHQSDIIKWFLQPSMNFMLSEYIYFSGALKFSFVHYGNIQTSYNAQEIEYFSLSTIADKTKTFIQPSINVQLGIPKYPWLKISGALGGISNYQNIATNLYARDSYFAIGLNFDFSKMKKKQ